MDVRTKQKLEKKNLVWNTCAMRYTAREDFTRHSAQLAQMHKTKAVT